MADPFGEGLQKLDRIEKAPTSPSGLKQAAKAGKGYSSGAPEYSQSGLGRRTVEYGPQSSTWYTGANAEGEDNGWEATVIPTFMERWNSALEKGEARDYFAQDDATGIVTWDHTTSDGVKHSWGDVLKDGQTLGNIYDEKWSGYDRHTANIMMGELVFDQDQKVDIYSESTDEKRIAKLDTEIRKAAEERRTQVEESLKKLEFEVTAEERAKAIKEGPADEAIVAGGAVSSGLLSAGAYARMTPGHPVGKAVAGVVGFGVGAWGAHSNRDALVDQAARAYEVTKISSEENGRLAGFATGVKEWSGFGGKLITPLSNFTQGTYDAIKGDIGDGESEFYRVDKETGERKAPTWMKAVDVAASVGDGFLQFASPVGLAAYSAQMSGVIGGEVSELALSGGKQFDYRKGTYDNIFVDDEGGFDPVSAAAGIGKIGIDAVQLGMARGLAGRADAALAATGRAPAYGAGSVSQGFWARLPGTRTVEDKAAAKLLRENDKAIKAAQKKKDAGEDVTVPARLTPDEATAKAAGATRVREGGYKYTVLDDGTIAPGRRAATLGLLAPSEQLGALSTTVVAMRETGKARGALTADDFYRAAQSVAAGERKIQTTLANAMGEGYEEAVQAVLEPVSMDAPLDGRQIFEQAAYGFAGGLGMGFGFSMNTPTADQRMMSMAMMAAITRSGGDIAAGEAVAAEWSRLTPVEKRARAAQADLESETIKAAYRKFAQDLRTDASAGVAGVAKLADAIETGKSKALSKASPRTDGAYVITQLENAAHPGHHVAASGVQVGELFQNHGRGMVTQLKTLRRDLDVVEQQHLVSDPNDQFALAEQTRLLGEIENLELSLEWIEKLNNVVEAHILQMYDPSATPQTMAAEADVLNDKLQGAFDMAYDSFEGQAMSEADKLALARAVSMVFTRDPQDQAGSYQMLLPQVSAKLTAQSANNVLEISHAILPAISGDHDGDKIRNLSQLILDRDEFVSARAGTHFLGAGDKVNIGTPGWEVEDVERIAEAANSNDPILNALAAGTKTQIGQAIKNRYSGRIEGEVLDRVLDQFYAELDANNSDARAKLLDGLALEAGGQITELARENLSNEWLWLDSLIVGHLQKFQEQFALHRPWGEAPPVGRPPAHVQEPRDALLERKLARAATLGNDLANAAEGDQPFRQAQKLHYTSLLSAVLNAGSSNDTQPLANMAFLYEQLGQKLTASQLAQVQAKDQVTARVFYHLEQLSLSARELNPDLSEHEALAVIANVEVWDDEQNGNISLTQWLLKESIAQERRELDVIFEASPELQAKHSKLRSMTKPDKQGSPGSRVNASRAFVEVAGGQQLYTLLGEDAEVFGMHLTVEQFVRLYQSEGDDAKYNLRQKLRTEVAYLGRGKTHNPPYTMAELKSGEVSPYRAVTDAILAVGDHRLSIDKDGNITGEYAARSRAKSEEFQKAHGDVRRALKEFLGLVGKQDGKLGRQAVVDLLEQNPDLARNVMDLIPDAAVLTNFSSRDGEIYIANWVYDMFVEPDAAVAEWIYLRNTMFSHWEALGMKPLLGEEGEQGEKARTYSSLPRRMHRVMYRLAKRPDGGAAYQAFIQMAEKDGMTVDDFFRWLNRNPGIRGEHEAPLVPWFDDVAEFDPDKTGGGWVQNLQGSELREAVTSLQRTAEHLVKDLVDERAAVREDNNTLGAIERVIRGEELQPGDGELYEQLQKALDIASERGVGLGPAAMVFQTVNAVRGFYPKGHTKGVSPPHLEALGTYEAQVDAFGYVTNYERMMAAITAQDPDAVSANMGGLAQGSVRLTDDNGNQVLWEKPTVEQIVKLMKNPETRPLARSILFPQVMERDGDGVLRPKMLVGKTLKSLLDGTDHKNLFPKADQALSQEKALRYVSMVETVARQYGGRFSVQKVVNDIVLARTSAATQPLGDTDNAIEAQLHKMTLDAYREVAQVLQAVGELASHPFSADKDPLAALSTDVRKIWRDLQAGKALGLDGDPDSIEVILDNHVAKRRMEFEEDKQELLRSGLEGEELSKRHAQLRADFEEFERKIELLKSDDGGVADAIAMLYVPANSTDTADNIAKKQAIVGFLRTHMDLVERTTGVRREVEKLRDQLLDKNVAEPELLPKEWEAVSRAVLSVYLDEQMGAPSGVTISPFPILTDENGEAVLDPRYFDTSFSFLVEPLLDRDGPLVAAAKEIHRLAGRQAVGLADNQQEKIVQLLGRTVLDGDRLGVWTADIPRAAIEANQRLDSSSAPNAIAMAGNSPKRLAAIVAATRRTYDVPGDEFLTKTTLSYNHLNAPDPWVEVPLVMPGHTEPHARPVAQLNNRFAKSVRIRFTDSQGQPQDLDLLAEDRNVGREFTGRAEASGSGLVEIHVERIKNAVDRLSEKHNLTPGAFLVDVEFIHPDSQPAEGWYNNLFFEGTSFKLDGDRHKSLLSTLWFAHEGINQVTQRAALQAAKLGKPALQVIKTPELVDIQAIESEFVYDLAAVIRAKTKLLLETDLGAGKLDPEYYNAVYKDIKLHHFVRGTDPTTQEPVLWTAEQVIDWQHNTNPGEPLPIENARLWIPSDTVLRSMLGEIGTQGVNRIFDDQLEVDLSRIPRYQGVTDQMLGRFEGVRTDTDVALEDTDVVNRARQQQLVVRAMPDQRTRAAFESKIKYFEEQQISIQEERGEMRRAGGFKPRKSIKNAVRAANDALRSENLAFDWFGAGIRFIGPRKPYENEQEKALLQDLEAATEADGHRMGWIYEESGEPHTREGILTQHALGNRKGGLRVAYKDLVVLKLESFNGDLELAKKRADYFIDRGAIVVLSDSSGGTDLIAELSEHIQSNDYESIRGSRHAYQYAGSSGLFQNQKARISTLTETRGVSQRNRVALFLSRKAQVGENALWVRPGDERLSSISIQRNLLKVNAWGNFNVPVELTADNSQVEQVRNHLKGMDTEEGRAFLLEQTLAPLRETLGKKRKGREITDADVQRHLDAATESFNSAWTRLMDRFDNHTGTVLPQPNDDFGTGDIIPLLSTQGQVLLYRHGHKAPKDRWRINEMLQQGLPSNGYAHNVATYGAELEDAATKHTGVVESFEADSVHGLRVTLQIKEQLFGGKYQLEWNGMKYVTTPMPDGMLPDHGIFEDWPVSGIGSLVDADSKESFDGRIDNHRNAFAYFGIDFRSDLAEFFFPGRRDDPAAQADAVSIMQGLGRRMQKIPVEHVDDMLKTMTFAQAFHEIVKAAAQSDPAGVDISWTQKLAEPSVESQIVTAMLAYLSTRGAKLEHVLRSGGFNDTSTGLDAQSRLMPRLFTQIFDRAIGTDLGNEMNRRFNDQINNPGDGTGYRLLPNWKLVIHNADRSKNDEGYLQFAEVYSSGDNPVKNGMSFDEFGSQQVSYHSGAIAYGAIGAETAYARDLDKVRLALLKPAQPDLNEGSVWNLLTSVPEDDRSMLETWQAALPAESVARDFARQAMTQTRYTFEKSGRVAEEDHGWSPETRAKYDELARDIVLNLGLKAEQVEIVDFWVRQVLGRPHGLDKNGEQLGWISGAAAIEAARFIEWNVKRNYLPTVGAQIPGLHVSDLQLIYRANRRRPAASQWTPKEGMADTDGRVGAENWNDWVRVALGTMFMSDTLFDPVYLTAADGIMNTYQNAVGSLMDLPVSLDALKSARLMDPETNRLVVSLDKHRDYLASLPGQVETARTSLDEMLGGNRLSGRYQAQARPASEISKHIAELNRWRKENGVPVPVDTTMRNFRKNGAQFINKSTNTKALYRGLINLRVGMALLNPLLYVSMGPEQWVRGSLDRLANTITGQGTTGVTARAHARVTQNLEEARRRRTEFANEPKSGEFLWAAAVGDALEALGLGSRYTPEQLEGLRQLYRTLGRRHDFGAMIHRDMYYLQSRFEARGWVGKPLAAFARAGSAIQDPTRGMRADTLAERYVVAAIQSLEATPTLHPNLTVDSLIAGLNTDPTFLKDQYPHIHKDAENAVAQIRSLKETVLSKMVKGVYEPLSDSPNMAYNFAGILLKLPLLFSGYAMNVATTLTGMQGFNDMAAAWLHGRKSLFRGVIASHVTNADEQQAEALRTYNMEDVLEGVDFTRGFIRGGLTHTGLFVTGLMATGLGLSGEDEEARKRRLMAENQGLPKIYSPLDPRNDIRNAGAIYLPDWLPFVGYGSEESKKDLDGPMRMYQPHWILKQFISPMMGMEKFFETGNAKHIIWGYEDAFGAFPLINSMMFTEAVDTMAELENLAAKKAMDFERTGNETDLISSVNFLIKIAAVGERMLFENSFVNSIYVGLDRYDRDNWVLPLTDSDGDLQVDAEGNPRPNNLALSPYLDDDGKLAQGYLGRDNMSAYLHSLTEHRGTLALVSTIFAGLSPAEADFFRYSQPVKLREQEAPPTAMSEAEKLIAQAYAKAGGAPMLTEAEAIQIIKNHIPEMVASGDWSMYNNRDAIAKEMVRKSGPGAMSIVDGTGKEVLTYEGAMAVFRGLRKGAVDLDHESLRGVHVTFEQRQKIDTEFRKEIVQEGVDLGLDRGQAETRMKRIMGEYGTDGGGLTNLIWNTPDKGGLSYSAKRVYKQLNTTYTIGPDGFPLATGVKRQDLLHALGLSPMAEYLVPEKSGHGLDARLNIVDRISGANTGLRGVELLDETEYIPTDVEIGKAIEEAIKEAAKADYKPNKPYEQADSGGGSGWVNYGGYGGYGYGGSGWRNFGGGGGYYSGGSSYFTRMNPLANNIAPYGDNLPFINTTNPLIRRADIQRQRVWSERGRLKQWQ